MTTIPGPKILDKVSIEYSTGNREKRFDCGFGPRFKEKLTIKPGKVSYKITWYIDDIDDTGEFEDFWEHKSSNSDFRAYCAEVFGHVTLLDIDNGKEDSHDRLPVKIVLHYQSGERKVMEAFNRDKNWKIILSCIDNLISFGEEKPEFLKL